MALRLRQDEAALDRIAEEQNSLTVETLRTMDQAVRSRVLEKFLKKSGVREPEAEHIALAEALTFSEKPSAAADFPGGVTIGREYGRLTVIDRTEPLDPVELACPGVTEVPQIGLRVYCDAVQEPRNSRETFSVVPVGNIILRSRRTGDAMRFPGGTKSLKKWFIDEKIPASQRLRVPVIADDIGVLGVYGGGANLDRMTGEGIPVRIRFETMEEVNSRESD